MRNVFVSRDFQSRNDSETFLCSASLCTCQHSLIRIVNLLLIWFCICSHARACLCVSGAEGKVMSGFRFSVRRHTSYRYEWNDALSASSRGLVQCLTPGIPFTGIKFLFFRTWMIIALHDFLSFVVLRMLWRFIVASCPCADNHLHKRHMFSSALFSSVVAVVSMPCECQFRPTVFPYYVS